MLEFEVNVNCDMKQPGRREEVSFDKHCPKVGSLNFRFDLELP